MNEYLIKTIVLLAVLLAVNIAGWTRFGRLDKSGRFFVFFLGLSFLTEAGASYAAYHFHRNLWLYNIMHPLLFTALWLFFYHALFRQRFTIPGWFILAGIWLGYAIDFLFYEKITELGSNFLQLEGLGVVSMVMLYFYSLTRSEQVVSLNRLLAFWVSAGLLILWCGSFFIWACLLVMNRTPEVTQPGRRVLYNILYLLNVLFYFYTAVLLLPPSKKSSHE